MLRIQVEQFYGAQQHQRLVDEINVLHAALGRVDDKLSQTGGAITQPAVAAQEWKLCQRQVWMEQRRTIEARLAEIGASLGWQRRSPRLRLGRTGTQNRALHVTAAQTYGRRGRVSTAEALRAGLAMEGRFRGLQQRRQRW